MDVCDSTIAVGQRGGEARWKARLCLATSLVQILRIHDARTRANGIQRHRSGDASPHSICVLAYLHKQRTVIHRCGNAGNLKMFYCERYVILSDGAGQDYSRVWREMHWYKNCAGIFRIWERKTSDAITLTFSTNLLRRDRVCTGKLSLRRSKASECLRDLTPPWPSATMLESKYTTNAWQLKHLRVH